MPDSNLLTYCARWAVNTLIHLLLLYYTILHWRHMRFKAGNSLATWLFKNTFRLTTKKHKILQLLSLCGGNPHVPTKLDIPRDCNSVSGKSFPCKILYAGQWRPEQVQFPCPGGWYVAWSREMAVEMICWMTWVLIFFLWKLKTYIYTLTRMITTVFLIKGDTEYYPFAPV